MEAMGLGGSHREGSSTGLWAAAVIWNADRRAAFIAWLNQNPEPPLPTLVAQALLSLVKRIERVCAEGESVYARALRFLSEET
ncbi:MAG: hypothetical protein R3B70_05895 [Polyangiaceae bacterium]